MATSEQRQALVDELVNDPLGRGYTGMTDQQAADDLNTEYRSRNRDRMSATEIWQAVDVTEFLALADGAQANIRGLLGFGELNPFGKEADIFVAIFGGGSNTITALQALRVEAISRAVEIGWTGNLTSGHVEAARA